MSYIKKISMCGFIIQFFWSFSGLTLASTKKLSFFDSFGIPSQIDPIAEGYAGRQLTDSEKEAASTIRLELAKASAVFLVVTNSWGDKTATGVVLKKNGDVWYKTTPNISLAVGRSGLGWGIGITDFREIGGVIKAEGDGRSPAGVFRLPQAFGSTPFGNFPFIEVSNQTICVDDSQSISYNKIIEMNSRPKDWNSFEKMAIPPYEIGIEVAHNHEIPESNAGSCIFIHLANESMTPTSGCTAMSKSNLKLLLTQLDQGSLLIQMPRQNLQKLVPEFAKEMILKNF